MVHGSFSTSLFVTLGLACLSGTAAFAAGTLSGSVLTFDSDEDETYAQVISAEVTQVIKRGTGTLTLSGNSVDFHGGVSIEEGVVVATHCNALGRGSGTSGTTSPNVIAVASGAQLRATFDADKSDGNAEGRGFRSVVQIAGSGPDGSGAFYYDHAASGTIPYWLVWELRLTDDAAIGGGYVYLARTVDLQGKTLTIKTAGTTPFYYGTVTNPGHIRLEGPAAKVWGHTFNGGATNVFTLTGSQPTFRLASANPIDWSLRWDCSGQGNFEVDAWSEGKNVINGDVDFLGTKILFWPQEGRSVTFNGAFRSAGFIDKGGAGTVNFRGPSNSAAYIYPENNGGLLHFKGNQTNVFGYVTEMGGSKIKFEDAGLVAITNGGCNLTGRFEKGQAAAELEVSGQTDFRLTKSGSSLNAGIRGTYSGAYERTRGVVTVGEGVSLSNNFIIGYNGQGAAYVTGAAVYWDVPSASNIGAIGAGSDCGYGYWSATDTTLVVPRYLAMAMHSANSTAFFVQRGGLTTIGNENFKTTVGGHGFVHLLDGATFNQTAGSTYLAFTDGTDGTGGDGALTVEGTGTTCKAAWFVGVQNRRDATTYLNVNDGGAVEFSYVVNNSGSAWTWPTGAKEYVSFDGGVWRTPWNVGRHNAFYSNGMRSAPDRFLCQRGGIVFDVRNSDVVMNAAIEAPTGLTLKSVTLPEDADFLAQTYIGPARLEIVDSALGVGATAYAPFDDQARRLRGDVVVTSRGTGYATETSQVKVWAPDGDRSWDCAFELEPAVSGGLVKEGTGALRLQRPNTYAGKTIVRTGWLEASVAGAIRDGNDVAIASGATLCISNALSVATLEGSGTLEGANRQSVTVTEAFVVAANDYNAQRAMKVAADLTFASGAKVRVDDPAGFVEGTRSRVVLNANSIGGTPQLEGLGGSWRLRVRGNSLVLGYNRGLCVIYR